MGSGFAKGGWAVSKRQHCLSGPVQPSVNPELSNPGQHTYPTITQSCCLRRVGWCGEGGRGGVHSSVQLGENKWFNKRLEVCNHLNFTSFVLFMISVHNFLTVPSAPPSLSIPLPSLSANYRTKQNYFDLYARRESSPTLPTLIPPPGAASRISHRCCCPPAQAVFFFFYFFIFFVFICFFQLSIDSGNGGWGWGWECQAN